MMICVTNRKLCRGDFLERIRQLAAGGADVILLRERIFLRRLTRNWRKSALPFAGNIAQRSG